MYWRDEDTATSIVAYDTLEKLIAAKPLQVVQFELDSDDSEVVMVSGAGQDNDVAEPVFTSDGVKTIFKQQVGAINEGITVTIIMHKSKYAKLAKVRSFSRKPNIETAFHAYGIIGFWFPATSPNAVPVLGEENVFSVDPTKLIGFTLKPPFFDYSLKEIGADRVRIIMNLSLGGQNLT